MRLTLVISSLIGGGAERVMSLLANSWAERGWDLTLLTQDDGSRPPSYPLDARVRHIPLGILEDSTNSLAGLKNNLHRIRVLRDALRASAPEAVLSFSDKTNILVLLAKRGLNAPIVVSERTVPGVHPLGRVWERLRTWTYPSADAVVVLTESAKAFFPQGLQRKLHVIPNPVLAAPATIPAPTAETEKQVIALGRFSEEKRFDLLLNAFAAVHAKHPDWKLLLLGEGPLRTELEGVRDRLGLTECVSMPGRVADPYPALQQSDLFVLCSRYEGFPNALCEAMSCGLPVIATDCPHGPREIVHHGEDGLLIPSENVEVLTEALDRLMADATERSRLGSQAVAVAERFALPTIMQQWEDLLYRLAPAAQAAGSQTETRRNVL